jgi:hypothetical protein
LYLDQSPPNAFLRNTICRIASQKPKINPQCRGQNSVPPLETYRPACTMGRTRPRRSSCSHGTELHTCQLETWAKHPPHHINKTRFRDSTGRGVHNQSSLVGVLGVIVSLDLITQATAVRGHGKFDAGEGVNNKWGQRMMTSALMFSGWN